MGILALDLAIKTGWAASGNPARSGVTVFDVKRGESPGMRFLRARAWLNDVFKLLGGNIKVIAYEQAHHRGGAATSVGVGLVTEVLAFAAANKIELMPVHTATLKKWATGHGKADKDMMIARSKQFGYNPVDDNEADACLILEYAKAELGTS